MTGHRVIRSFVGAAGLTAAALASPAVADFTLSAEGDCPGLVTLSWDGAPPDHRMVLFFSQEKGRRWLPGGTICGGTEIGLGGDLFISRPIFTGSNGQGQLNGRLPTMLCGGFVQAIVIEGGGPCTTSNVARIPE